MFSIENLAWRTSNTPGYTVSDLPVCERGPNGGRVMWFPPYGLTFSETVTPNWQGTDFIGRPEPIYTYKNTSRTGSLTWKIVVDHPSVLNVIVNKVLSNETNKTRVDSILESFFAGCRKYDLYELAKKYNTIPPNDLFVFQNAISSKDITAEQIEYIVKTVDNSPQVSSDNSIGGAPQVNFGDYVNTGFYFDNDIPKNFNVNFKTTYDNYTGQIDAYKTGGQKVGQSTDTTASFFNDVIIANKDRIDKLINDLEDQFIKFETGTVTITIDSSTSARASESYNNKLSSKRIQSAAIYITGNTKMKKYVDEKRLVVRVGRAAGEFGETQQFNPKTKQFEPNTSLKCGDGDKRIKDKLATNDDKF
jgi:hypothetical protein